MQRLLEHHDHRVQPLDRERLLAEEGPPQVAVHRLDLREAPQQLQLAFGAQRLAIASGLDPLAQPVALLMARNVLDLVGDGRAVGLSKVGEDFG